jgi:hypothetical protein
MLEKGETIEGEEFGGMVVAAVRFFDELIRLNIGVVSTYRGRHFSPLICVPPARRTLHRRCWFES